MTGPGYWLNPANQKWIAVTRHELTMRDASAMAELGVALDVINAAQQIAPYGHDAVEELRILGIRSGLIRVRDQGLYISVQCDAPLDAKTELLRFVRSFSRRQTCGVLTCGSAICEPIARLLTLGKSLWTEPRHQLAPITDSLCPSL